MVKFLTAVAASALMAGAAQAVVVFNVTGTFATVAGAPAGTLTGTFTANDALSSVTAFDLTASAAGAFAGYRYTNVNSAVTAQSLPQFFQLNSTTGGNELRLYFTTPLTMAGATISPTFSYESEPSGGNRLPSGTVTRAVAGVPEPASWAMMLMGFAGLGHAMRRRRVTTRIRFA